jgi:hypothetical protein
VDLRALIRRMSIENPLWGARDWNRHVVSFLHISRTKSTIETTFCHLLFCA